MHLAERDAYYAIAVDLAAENGVWCRPRMAALV